MYAGHDENHEETREHQRMVKELEHRSQRILRIRDHARFIPEQMDEHVSRHGPWRGKIYEVIGRAFLQKDQTLIQDAEDLLRQYKHLERISLLELAVWKFACLSMDQKQDRTKQSFLEWSRWYTSGWKQHKKSHYRCNQVVILMKAIVPFLLRDDETEVRELGFRYTSEFDRMRHPESNSEESEIEDQSEDDENYEDHAENDPSESDSSEN